MDDSTLSNVPGCDQRIIRMWWEQGVECLPQLMALTVERRREMARRFGLQDKQVEEMESYLRRMPSVDMSVSMQVEGSEKKSSKRSKPVHIALITEALNEDGKLRPEKQQTDAGGWAEEEEQDSDMANSTASPAVFHVLITLRRTNEATNSNIVTPVFTKPKQEAGTCYSSTSALNSCSYSDASNSLPRNTQLQRFTLTCPMPTRGQYAYSVLLISDSYLGLDQVRTVNLVSHEEEAIELPVPRWQLLDGEEAGENGERGHGVGQQRMEGERQWVQQAVRTGTAAKGGNGKPFKIEYDEDDEGQ